MNILILGANGFIGSNLSAAILAKTDWHIFAMDMTADKLTPLLTDKRFHFVAGDITLNTQWVTEHIKKSDIVLPLVAIATPALYVQDPLRVFELDFEANLNIIRQCVHAQKRIIFPSTSEVYGMCPDMEFDEETSHLVTGPIHKERWIYATSKQLLDRIIYAYGNHQHLNYTLFRPFNWYGPHLDNIHNPKAGSSRVMTQFIGHILRGEDILLVDGGEQQRSFMFIDDGVDALLKIIANQADCARHQIFNLGHPRENISIRQLAEMLIRYIKTYPEYAAAAHKTQLVDISAKDYYGIGYQDVALRVPSIERAKKYLHWEPQVNLEVGLQRTVDFYLKEAKGR